MKSTNVVEQSDGSDVDLPPPKRQKNRTRINADLLPARRDFTPSYEEPGHVCADEHVIPPENETGIDADGLHELLPLEVKENTKANPNDRFHPRFGLGLTPADVPMAFYQKFPGITFERFAAEGLRFLFKEKGLDYQLMDFHGNDSAIRNLSEAWDKILGGKKELPGRDKIKSEAAQLLAYHEFDQPLPLRDTTKPFSHDGAGDSDCSILDPLVPIAKPTDLDNKKGPTNVERARFSVSGFANHSNTNTSDESVSYKTANRHPTTPSKPIQSTTPNAPKRLRFYSPESPLSHAGTNTKKSAQAIPKLHLPSHAEIKSLVQKENNLFDDNIANTLLQDRETINPLISVFGTQEYEVFDPATFDFDHDIIPVKLLPGGDIVELAQGDSEDKAQPESHNQAKHDPFAISAIHNEVNNHQMLVASDEKEPNTSPKDPEPVLLTPPPTSSMRMDGKEKVQPEDTSYSPAESVKYRHALNTLQEKETRARFGRRLDFKPPTQGGEEDTQLAPQKSEINDELPLKRKRGIDTDDTE